MEKKRLLIHIGLRGAGTSAIQAFLRENRDPLVGQGVLYPLNPAKRSEHNRLAWHLMDPKYLPVHREPFSDETSAALWDEIKAEIRESRVARAILSGGDFSYVGEPQRLAALCDDFEVKILAYLRRQDQYVLSIYEEEVRNFEFMLHQTFEQFLDDNRDDAILHYERFLQRWADAFGEKNIEVGIYSDSGSNDALIADFAARAGIRPDPALRVVKEAPDVRLSGGLLEVKRILNQFRLNASQHQLLLDSLMNTPMARKESAAGCGDPIRMSRERQKAYMDQFREGNHAVACRYLGLDADLFPEPDIQERNGTEPPRLLSDGRALLKDLVGPILQDLTSQLAAASPGPIKERRTANHTSGETSPQVPFRKSGLTPESAALFNLPLSAQDSDNLYSMSNWVPIYIPLLDQIQPKCIVEIGSEYGGNTRHLGRYCIEHGVRLHIVDTHPTRDPELEQSVLVSYHQCRSIDFLQGFEGADVLFVDGDHNYQTVGKELELIAHSAHGRGTMLALMHDTGWPSGIIDCYYDPSIMEAVLPPLSSTQGPLPWKDTLDDLGFGRGHVAYALKAGGPKNGVRPAIEDFVARHTGWRTAYTTPFYGLCFLWKDDSPSQRLSACMQNLIQALARVEPIFATLEWNRLLLYIQKQFMGAEWKRQQMTLEKVLEENKKLLDDNEHAGEIWRLQQQWIEHLERKVRSLGRP